MTPLEIKILLHYLTNADDFMDGARPPAVRDAIDRFLTVPAMLQREVRPQLLAQKHVPAEYSLTDRGRVYADALMRVPPPVEIQVVRSGWRVEWPKSTG